MHTAQGGANVPVGYVFTQFNRRDLTEKSVEEKEDWSISSCLVHLVIAMTLSYESHCVCQCGKCVRVNNWNECDMTMKYFECRSGTCFHRHTQLAVTCEALHFQNEYAGFLEAKFRFKWICDTVVIIIVSLKERKEFIFQSVHTIYNLRNHVRLHVLVVRIRKKSRTGNRRAAMFQLHNSRWVCIL